MFGFFQKSNVPDETFGRLISQVDAQRVRDVWTQYCAAENIEIPEKCKTELKKRIQSASSSNSGGKAKLEFKSCGLEDRHAKLLIRALALAPCISKLDLSGNNISNKVAEIIIKLLKAQLLNILQK